MLLLTIACMNEIITILPLSDIEAETSSLTGIYGLQNKAKPDKWNIGQTIRPFRKRFYDYKRGGCRGQPKIFKSILKNGWNGFNKVILEICPTENLKTDEAVQKWMDEREDYWILFYDSINKGYNCRRGGSHGKHSEATKKLIGDLQRGRAGNPWSNEAKLRQSIKRMGIKFSPLHCENISKGKLGKKLSPNTRKAMSITRKGKKLSQKHIDGLKRGWATKRRLKPVSEETKKEISRGLMGRKLSLEHRTNISIAQKGKKMPQSFKDLIKENWIVRRQKYGPTGRPKKKDFLQIDNTDQLNHSNPLSIENND
jgi:group I intron endonuclease